MRNSQAVSFTGGMIAVFALSVVAVGQTPSTADSSQDSSARHEDRRVDELLTRLEERQVDDIKAAVKWELSYPLEEETATEKRGTIWYRADEPMPRFLVEFDAKVQRNRKYKWNEKHLFDGRWYVEQQEKGKTFTKRELRRPGESYDPYKLGEGPFPVPFGQKKQAILDEFEVELIKPRRTDPKDTTHLKLTPKAGSATGRSYKVLDFWVRSDGGPLDGLPIRVRAAKKEPTGRVSSMITVTFDDIALNKGLAGDIFRLEPPEGYHVAVEPLPRDNPEAVRPAGDSQ